MEIRNLEFHRENILKIVHNNGPDEDEYKLFDKIIDDIDNDTEGVLFRKLISVVLKNETIFGHTFQKPYGYAGDFLLIEKIYQKHESDNSLFKKWDKFYHSHEATEAVRNRKTYFINELKKLTLKNKKARVLILGSGPATDVYEFFLESKNKGIKFDLLDIDQNAISYASKKNQEHIASIKFIKANVIRFSTKEKYDLIWSAGLFDYLDDKLFSFLLKRFKDNLRPEGQIIIGNFSPSNPTIKVMEIMTEWMLNYRNKEHLINLAQIAGIKKERCSVENEPLGINLFLKIK